MKTIFYGMLLSAFAFSACQPPAKKQPPNILFIIADDWSYPYAGVYGDSLLRTPNIDRLAGQGTVFENAYCASPSCTPSRAAILTGMYPHNLGEGVNLVGKLDASIPTYVQLMRQAGYAVAFERKGWGPGDYRQMGYTQNPCGDSVSFQQLLDTLPKEKPFFFWFGTNDPHRPYDSSAGKKAGIDFSKIKVPGFLPDAPAVREDLADYFSEIEHLDTEVGVLLEQLRKSGRLDNTIVVVTADNGMPFPHAKANLYDHGTRVPLIVTSFVGGVEKQRQAAFVNLIDLAPTFLQWAGVQPPAMDGQSLVALLQGKAEAKRDAVFLERERHCLCRADFDYKAGYPMRAIRTHDFLYIQNLRPDRNPAGDESIPNTPSVFGDVDGGLTKMFVMDHRLEPAVQPFFKWGFEKRPAEELYDVKNDPFNLRNLANDEKMAGTKKQLQQRLQQWMEQTKDPRRNGGGDEIDHYDGTTHAWITRDGIHFWEPKK